MTEMDRLNPGDYLEKIEFTLGHPTSVWAGLLLAYSASAPLFIDEDGYVAGLERSSGENPAQVYQYLVGPNESSDTLQVP